MDSLFTRIFLAFWITVLLLFGSVWLLERAFGDWRLDAAERRLAAHAETAALLWNEGNRQLLPKWLRGLHGEPGTRPLLLDAAGQPVLDRPLPRPLRRWLPRPITPGLQHLEQGRYVLAVPLPDTQPRLFLVTQVNLGRLGAVPPMLRLVLAFLVSGLVSMGLAILLTRRLRRLRAAAQSLARGELTMRVDESGRDEVAALGRDFNVMAERLAQLVESHQQLVRDVSHELRSPLARLRVALELAERSGDPARALARIGKEADELERLTTDLLSLARLQSGRAQLEKSDLALMPLLREIVRDAAFEAEPRRRRVSLQGESDLTVTADPVLLRAAIENVVRNAVRHTAEGTAVDVALAVHGAGAEIRVEDHGPGVPDSELGRLFEPFTRVGEARDRAAGGFGLGLAIAGRVMNAHGGTVQAFNRPEGGLRVVLHLPGAGLSAGKARG